MNKAKTIQKKTAKGAEGQTHQSFLVDFFANV